MSFKLGIILIRESAQQKVEIFSINMYTYPLDMDFFKYEDEQIILNKNRISILCKHTFLEKGNKPVKLLSIWHRGLN